MDVLTSQRAQIAPLKADKALTSIPPKYANFLDIFFKDLAVKLLKYTIINDHTINLVKDYQPSYKAIYSLKLVELEILKTYIETNLAKDFIQPFKSLLGTLILFIKKSDRSFHLCVNYKGLNYLIIKN